MVVRVREPESKTVKRGQGSSPSVFWVVLILILMLGLVPRLLIAPASLPYIDHPDEPSLYLLARQWRGLFQFDEPLFQGYPPIYVGLNLVVQVIMEQLGHPVQGEVIGVLRVISCFFSMATALVTALIARRIAGGFAGLVAAALWAFSPFLIRQAPVALTDPLAALVTMVALWLAVIAATERRNRYVAVWSIAVGAVGIFIKYPVAPVMVAGGLVLLWMLVVENRKQATRYIAIVFLIALVAGAGMLLNSGAQYSTRYIDRDGATGFGNLLVPAYAINNIAHTLVALEPLTPAVFLAIVALAVVVYFYARRRGLPRVKEAGVLLLVALIIVQPWAVTVFSVVSASGRIRDVIPAVGALCALLGVALAQLVLVLPKRRQRLAQAVVAVGLVGFVFWPQVQTTLPVIHDARLPDTRVALRAWAEETLEPAGVYVTYANDKTFNNAWSGLPGSKWFAWLRGDDFASQSPEEWRQGSGIAYAVLTDGDLLQLAENPNWGDYEENLLLLREFGASTEHRGPAMSVYRLWRMEQETDVAFGEGIRLVGYDQQVSDAALSLRLYWQADVSPDAEYSLFVHLAPRDSRGAVSQWDGPPAMSSRPTYTWTEPSETIVGEWISVEIPEGIPPGEYRVLVGLYDFYSGQRLAVIDNGPGSIAGILEGDSIYLFRLHIAG